jgi:hypothetical protein
MNRSTPRRMTPPRAESLVKVYLGLLAVSLLLLGVLAHRQIAGMFRNVDVVQIAAEPRDPTVQRNYGPSINWGGGKR